LEKGFRFASAGERERESQTRAGDDLDVNGSPILFKVCVHMREPFLAMSGVTHGIMCQLWGPTRPALPGGRASGMKKLKSRGAFKGAQPRSFQQSFKHKSHSSAPTFIHLCSTCVYSTKGCLDLGLVNLLPIPSHHSLPYYQPRQKPHMEAYP
jgi:hypothetical protein